MMRFFKKAGTATAITAAATGYGFMINEVKENEVKKMAVWRSNDQEPPIRSIAGMGTYTPHYNGSATHAGPSS